ncbi:hypothetical protein HUJ04_002935 [Dendroctonus ponderosae]|nr:hypothetical protein HUJ04_001382 [Dendroctonus ponderosae]KAH1014035.1 hypothetical protein HUJ04_002935 [Dendroctonus ponderosae]KAH1024090.1 hypothetical protein HUJ05_003647 [Dendroctonus ponderosae]
MFNAYRSVTNDRHIWGYFGDSPINSDNRSAFFQSKPRQFLGLIGSVSQDSGGGSANIVAAT